jgi:hypothetical protein
LSASTQTPIGMLQCQRPRDAYVPHKVRKIRTVGEVEDIVFKSPNSKIKLFEPFAIAKT